MPPATETPHRPPDRGPARAGGGRPPAPRRVGGGGPARAHPRPGPAPRGPRAHLSGLRPPAGLAGPSASSGFRRLPSAVRLRPRLHLAGGGGLATRGRVRTEQPGPPARAPRPGAPSARPGLTWRRRRGGSRTRRGFAAGRPWRRGGRGRGSSGPRVRRRRRCLLRAAPTDCARPAPNRLYRPPPRPPGSRARRAGRDHRAYAGGSRPAPRAPQAVPPGAGEAGAQRRTLPSWRRRGAARPTEAGFPKNAVPSAMEAAGPPPPSDADWPRPRGLGEGYWREIRARARRGEGRGRRESPKSPVPTGSGP